MLFIVNSKRRLTLIMQYVWDQVLH